VIAGEILFLVVGVCSDVCHSVSLLATVLDSY